MPNLAVTPVDMARMTASNRAVSSSQMAGMTYNLGYDVPSDLPLPFRRGMDKNTAWEYQKGLEGKVKTARAHLARKAYERSSAVESAGQNGGE